jgi:hypothetical protein
MKERGLSDKVGKVVVNVRLADSPCFRKDLDDDDGEKKLEALEAEREPSTRIMKTVLGDKVKENCRVPRPAFAPPLSTAGPQTWKEVTRGALGRP